MVVQLIDTLESARIVKTQTNNNLNLFCEINFVSTNKPTTKNIPNQQLKPNPTYFFHLIL